MTRRELVDAFTKVLAIVREQFPGEKLFMDGDDLGFTVGVGIKSAMRAIEAHAWSWDGKVDKAAIVTFLTNPKDRHRTLHLGNPQRPGEVNGAVRLAPGVLT